MNSGRLWNSHQRHKFLRAEASRDILRLRVSEMAFQEEFSTPDSTLFRQNTRKTGNNAVEMSHAFHDTARRERFTDLRSMSFKTGKRMFTILIDGAYFCWQLW